MIAYLMLYSVAVGAPVVLASHVVAALLRRHGRAERLVWLAGLGLAVALPLAALLQTPGAAPAGTGPASVTGSTGIIGLPTVFVVPDAGVRLPVGATLAWTWLIASGVLLARLGVAVTRLARSSRSWEPDTMNGSPVWLTGTLGPAVWGLLRPRVLIPEWLARMPAHQRALILLHEQEHIRAGDPWLMAASRLVPILAPWNPVLWILSSRLSRAVELDCDRRVLRHRPDVRAYGSTLIDVSARGSGRLVAVAAFAESEAPLRSRILNMTTPARTVSVVALLSSMVLGVTLILVAFQVPVPTVAPDPVIGQTRRDAAGDGRIVTGRTDAAGRSVRGEPAQPGQPAAPARPEPSARPTRPARPVQPPRPEASTEPAGRPPEPARPVTRGEVDIAAQPVFTPYTVAPQLLNLTEIQRALVAEYPTVLRDAGIGGTVNVWFFIDEEGLVQDIRLNSSSGQPELDRAALGVADIYRFRPAVNRDRRVPVWVNLPITFQVQ